MIVFQFGCSKEKASNSSHFETEISKNNVAETNLCQSQWQNWVQKYAAATPFAAYQKTSSLPLNEQDLEKLLTLDPESEQFEKEAKRISPLYETFSKMGASLISEHVPSYGARDEYITEAVAKQIEESGNDPSKLSFVYVGQAHAVDFFLTQNARAPVLYATFPVHDKSYRGSEEYRILSTYDSYKKEVEALSCIRRNQEIHERFTIKKIHNQSKLDRLYGCNEEHCLAAKKTLKELIKYNQEEISQAESMISICELSLMLIEKIKKPIFTETKIQNLIQDTLYLDLIVYRQHVSQAKQSLEWLFPKENNENVLLPTAILIGDIHYLNETSLAEELPTADCLKKRGIQSIDVMIEGFHSSHTDLDYEYVINSFDVQQTSSYQEYEKLLEKNPELEAIYRSKKAQLHPNLVSFIQKIKTYEDAGIAVKYRGVEPEKKKNEVLK